MDQSVRTSLSVVLFSYLNALHDDCHIGYLFTKISSPIKVILNSVGRKSAVHIGLYMSTHTQRISLHYSRNTVD